MFEIWAGLARFFIRSRTSHTVIKILDLFAQTSIALGFLLLENVLRDRRIAGHSRMTSDGCLLARWRSNK